MSETVLERNLSFIDTPGFDAKSELRADKQALVAHLEQLFQRNAAMPELSASEMLGILSGAGGVQVDVVLYICSPAGTLISCLHTNSVFANIVQTHSPNTTSPP
jgi:hypothetical protein